MTQLFFNNEKRIQFFRFNRIRYTHIYKAHRTGEREREKEQRLRQRERMVEIEEMAREEEEEEETEKDRKSVV